MRSRYGNSHSGTPRRAPSTPKVSIVLSIKFEGAQGFTFILFYSPHNMFVLSGFTLLVLGALQLTAAQDLGVPLSWRVRLSCLAHL